MIVVEHQNGVTTWSGAGWLVRAVPWGEFTLATAEGTLRIHDEDPEEFAQALISCADDGLARTFESCMAPPNTAIGGRASRWAATNVLITADARHVTIDPQYQAGVFTIAVPEAYTVAVALLEAKDWFIAGPCPLCGISVADDHPCNGCPG